MPNLSLALCQQDLLRRASGSAAERDAGDRVVEVVDRPMGAAAAGISERDHHRLQVEVEEEGRRARGRDDRRKSSTLRHHRTQERQRVSGKDQDCCQPFGD